MKHCICYLLLAVSSVHMAHGNVNTACVHQQSFPCCCYADSEWASAERCECMHKSCTDQTYSECMFASKTHGYSRFHRETYPTIWCYPCLRASLILSLSFNSYGSNCYCFLTLVVVHIAFTTLVYGIRTQRTHCDFNVHTKPNTPATELNWMNGWMNDREREEPKNEPDSVSWLSSEPCVLFAIAFNTQTHSFCCVHTILCSVCSIPNENKTISIHTYSVVCAIWSDCLVFSEALAAGTYRR